MIRTLTFGVRTGIFILSYLIGEIRMDKAVKLSDLCKYDNIVIQCHDNPDPDTVSCGFALFWYFEKLGRKARLIYSGRNKITKPNMIHMVDDLNIPIEHVKELDYEPDLIILVDCSIHNNAAYFSAKQYAVIDHHSSCNQDYPICYKRIEPRYKACASLVAKLIWEDNSYITNGDKNGFPDPQNKINYNDDIRVSTALYYGLFKDSAEFTEVLEQEDENLRRNAKVDKILFNRLRYSNLSVSELGIIGEALHHTFCKDRYAIALTKTNDRNILGVVSDYLIQVDNIEASVAYCKNGDDIRLSVRTCSEYIAAEEIAKLLTKGIGGGHRDKAAGPITDPVIRTFNPYELKNYINHELAKYFRSFDVLDISKEDFDVTGLQMYERIPQTFGYAELYGNDFEIGTTLWICETGGKKSVPVANSTLIIVSNCGHAEVLDRVIFDGMYDEIGDEYMIEDPEVFGGVILNADKSSSYPIPKLKCCRSRENVVYAKKIEKATKVITKQAGRYEYHYQYMSAGDYLVVDTAETKRRIIEAGEKKCLQILEKWKFAQPDRSYIGIADREYVQVYPMRKEDFEAEYCVLPR